MVGVEVKDVGNVVFLELQVDVSYVVYVDEVVFEVVVVFKQFWVFVIIQLGIEVESDVCYVVFVVFVWFVDVKVVEVDDL